MSNRNIPKVSGLGIENSRFSGVSPRDRENKATARSIASQPVERPKAWNSAIVSTGVQALRQNIPGRSMATRSRYCLY